MDIFDSLTVSAMVAVHATAPSGVANVDPETYQEARDVPDDRGRLAYEELLAAEGNDWCWWYAPEHDSSNRIEFDQLYRSHLANVYRFMNLDPSTIRNA